MKTVFILTFLLLLIASCTKPLVETGSVNGIVKDATTGNPIANADVFLLQNELGDVDILSGGGTSEQIDYTTTDANGNFSFLFDYDKNYFYLCGAEATLYFDLNQEFKISDEVKEGNNVEVLLQPVAWLSVRVKTVNEYEPSDFIGINSLLNDPYYGEDIDTIEVISVYGGLNFQLSWFLFEGGIQVSSPTELIYCPSFDTTYFEILY